MNAGDLSHLLPRTKELITNIDQVRNQKLADYVPWLADILKDLP